MNIVFNCPGCGAILRMKEEYGGRRGRCPHCQGAITVPAIETDAGMDLLPLEEGADDKGGSSSAATSPSQTPASSYSTPSRFSGSQGASSEAQGATLGGDSNIGLAPLEERPAKASPATSSVTTTAGAPSSKIDSNLGLAPLDELTKKPVTAAPQAPAVKSEAGESAIGLAPLEDVKEKPAPAPARAPAKSPASKEDTEDFGLAPLGGAQGAKPAVPATATTTAKGGAAGNGPAKPAAPSEDPARIACTKCGARMRAPANAAGRTVVCPKCKNKFRVPESAPTVTSPSSKITDSDTLAISDTPSSSGDLGDGMLDMLGDSGLSSAKSPALDGQGAGLGGPKLAAKSSSGGILGLPPLAVYGGAAGLALVLSLLLVFLLGGFSSSTTTVSQAPAGAPTASAGQAATPPASPGTTTSAPPVAQMPTTSAAVAPAPVSGGMPPNPTTVPPNSNTPSPPAGPGLGGLRARVQAQSAASGQQPPAESAAPAGMPAQPMPAGTPAATVSPTTAPAAAADPANWRQRMPVVRVEGDGNPRAGETPVPAANPSDPMSWVIEVMEVETQIAENLKQIMDVESAKRVAPTWAGLMERGLDRVRKIRLAGGPPKPQPNPGGGGGLRARALAASATTQELENLAKVEGEMLRIASMAGAMPILEAALLDQARRDPTGALAAVLTERGVAITAAPGSQ
jgi:phage FluMu protein Com